MVLPGGRCIQLLQQRVEQSPEKTLAGIATDAADLASFVDKNKDRRQAFDLDRGQIGRHVARNIDAPQRCTQAFLGFVVDWRDVAIERFAPDATGLFEYHKLGRVGFEDRGSNKHRARQRSERK
ncbi:MAG: hypothetical protein ACREQD_12125 [Candidatus Binataceae bacterium]